MRIHLLLSHTSAVIETGAEISSFRGWITHSLFFYCINFKWRIPFHITYGEEMGTQTNLCSVSGAVWGVGQQAAPAPRFTRGPDERNNNQKKHSYNSAVCFLYKPGHVFPAGERCVVLSLTFLLCVLFVHAGFS